MQATGLVGTLGSHGAGGRADITRRDQPDPSERDIWFAEQPVDDVLKHEIDGPRFRNGDRNRLEGFDVQRSLILRIGSLHNGPLLAHGFLRAVHADLNWPLSIFSVLIFDSSVDDGTPSRAAAPNGPDTRPLLSLSAASMTSFSCVARVGVATGGGATSEGFGDRPPSHRSSIARVSESAMMIARSMTFCSSRMLPGQSYAWSR